MVARRKWTAGPTMERRQDRAKKTPLAIAPSSSVAPRGSWIIDLRISGQRA